MLHRDSRPLVRPLRRSNHLPPFLPAHPLGFVYNPLDLFIRARIILCVLRGFSLRSPRLKAFEAPQVSNAETSQSRLLVNVLAPSLRLFSPRLPHSPPRGRSHRRLRDFPCPATVPMGDRRHRQQRLPLARLSRPATSRLDFRHQPPLPPCPRPAPFLGRHATTYLR